MSLRASLVLAAALALSGGPALAAPPVVKWSHDAVRWAPSFIQVVDRGHPERRKLRVRVYADPDYRAHVVRWQERAREMFDDLNILVGPTFGVRFEVESCRRWEDTPSGMSADTALELLAKKDPGEDVDLVVGFIAALPLLSNSMHAIGMAHELGNHFVMRGMADLAELRDLKKLRLSDEEEKKLYVARKWHKEIAVFLHEWGHTLGAIHSSDRINLMNTTYSHEEMVFSIEQMNAMDLALDCRLGQPRLPAWRCQRLLAYLEATNTSDWYAHDRQQTLEILRSGVKGTAPEGTPSGEPALSADQVRSWNAVLGLLDQAREAQENGERAEALKAVVRAEEQARALPAEGGARIWLSVARHYLALGALTRTEEALAHARGEAGAAQTQTELERARRLFGLPWPKGVAPENEPSYVQTFETLAKGLGPSSGDAVAKALAAYPEAPGLLMLECEVHVRAGRAKQADRSCNAALARAPELARAHYLLGLMEFDRGREGQATAHLRRAVELDGLAAHHWSSLGAVYRMKGRTRELHELADDYEKRFHQKLP